MIVVGIDPGGAATGIVTRDRDHPVDARLVLRLDDDDNRTYLSRVLAQLALGLHDAELVAVEGVNPPTPQMGTTSVKGLLDTARILGAIEGWAWTELAWDRLVVVPPGGHGSAPLRTYPPHLIGPRETKGTGVRRHLRSAWDVAGAARTQQRLNAAL